MYEGPPVADEDVISIYVIVNGSLGMSCGKIAAQTWHCGWLVGHDKFFDGFDPEIGGELMLYNWIQQGRRVVTRLAETEGVFERARKEVGWIEQQDEGVTEVPRGSITCFATRPYKRSEAPKILSHKRIQLL